MRRCWRSSWLPAILAACTSSAGSGTTGLATTSVPTTTEATTTTTSTTTSTTTTTTVVEAETPSEFLANYVGAQRQGNGIALFQLLHPVMLELYGVQVCQDYLAQAVPDSTFDMELLAVVDEPTTWIYEVDGRSVEVPDTYTVEVEITAFGETARQEMHLGLTDGDLGWFTDCGDPLPEETGVPSAEALAEIGGDDTSAPFEAPSSWRVEAEASDASCLVAIHDDASGDVVTSKFGDADFTIQVREAGTFYMETTGCGRAVALPNP